MTAINIKTSVRAPFLFSTSSSQKTPLALPTPRFNPVRNMINTHTHSHWPNRVQKLKLLAFSAARGPLKPRRLRFDEHGSSSSSSQDYTIPNYVRLLLEASCLNWDQLSAMRPQSEHLLHPSLFDQGQFLMFDSHFDTRLLFDHVNEVLLETKRSHFVSPYWPAFAKPRICSLPLEEAVVDEIMRESEFYLLPRTQRRTLDQLLAVDFSGPRSRPDFRAKSEQIIAHVSEEILEESVLDVVLQLYS